MTTRAYVLRMAASAGALLMYGLSFFPLYREIGTAAFLLGIVPCAIGGTLLGVWGGLIVVAGAAGLDRHLAMSLGIAPATGPFAAFVALATKVLMAVGPGLIAQSARQLRRTNRQLAEEVQLRCASQRRLEASEGRYRALVESAGEGVGLFDDEDRCLFANQALLSTLGKGKNEVLHLAFESHLDESSRCRVREHRANRSPATQCYEVAPNHQPEAVLLVTETTLSGEAAPASDGASAGTTLRVIRDLTIRREWEKRQLELERQLQRSQALQSLAVLAGGVAHDFNNLLSGIIGNAEFALRRIPQQAPLELTQCLDEILEFANEAGQLSRQMLAYAGRRSLSTGIVDVNREISETLRLLHSTIDAQATLRLDLSETLQSIRADRHQLRQVVTNLVLNALEAMAPARGTLTIRSQSIHLDEERLAVMKSAEGLVAGQYVSVTVSDTGSGLAEESRERIFEPFFSTKSPGRGMGLAASMGIVRSHRGWIDVTSRLGVGSTFELLFPPAEEEMGPSGAATTVSRSPSRAACILLIDDERAVRLVTKRLLTSLGQAVLTAESGRRGLELFEQHHESIDLVLLDLTMPELSGAEVLRELRRIRRDVKCVVTSGFHPSNAQELIAAPNVVGFLEKPHSLASLETVVLSHVLS